MLTYEQALNLINKLCADNIVKHCLLVSEKSAEIAKKVAKNDYKIDVELCKVGGLVHDIGRSQTHSIQHGIKGAELLKEHPKLARIAKTHIGAGIPKDEAVKLGLGDEDYLPETIEEKVVAYADKLVQKGKFVKDASMELKKLRKELGENHPGVKRLKRLEYEIKELIKE